MSTSTMSIQSFKEIAPLLSESTSICLKGIHGIGKSSLGKQLRNYIKKQRGDELGEFPFIDRRLSQQTSGDLLGLPSTKTETTRWNPPDWYKQACDQPCFLQLDELNRALPEVMQAAFQIILDRELNGWKLHPKTRIMTGINTGNLYTINEMDPALVDRFWFVELVATVNDFLIWAREVPESDSVQASLKMQKNIHDSITDFISHNSVWLDPSVSEEPSSKSTSRRSWEKLSNNIVEAKMFSDDGVCVDKEKLYLLSQGYVGIEAAIAYSQFVNDVFGRFNGKDIVNNYKDVKKLVENAGTERRNAAIEQIISYMFELDDAKTVNDEGKQVILSSQQRENIKQFVDTLEKNNDSELILSFWQKATVHGSERLVLAQVLHSIMKQQVLNVFLKKEKPEEQEQTTQPAKKQKEG